MRSDGAPGSCLTVSVSVWANEMFGRIRVSLWLLAAALPAFLAVAGGAGLVLSSPAHAQFWADQRYPFLQRQHSRPQRSGGFFQNWFGGGAPEYERTPRERYEPQRHEPTADSGHAPPPHKNEAKDAPPPSTNIVVMGDGMADWLAYGLEDAFSDSPDVAIMRKDKVNSGLLRYEAKGDLDWWHVARDILAQEKANYVVMMLGVTDRQNIRERDLAREAEKEAKEQDEKKAADAAAHPDQQGKLDQKSDAADDKKAKKKTATGVVEFRSDQWEKIYTKRIDDTIAALKSKGVPVFWVGLPSIRGTRSTADASYLNDLFRARAERAGIVYIDVWDGFVDETGRFTTYGPDYEGQSRRLRSADGVYFTKYGARKLAHYVEREIRRYMSNRIVALPTAPAAPAPASGKPAERPLAGPVVPLTAVSSTSDELLGGGSAGRVHGDALAAQVLVKGEPVPPEQGRADDFAWPPGSAPRPPVAAQTQPKARASATAKADTVAPVSSSGAGQIHPAVAAPAKPPPVEPIAPVVPLPADAKVEQPAATVEPPVIQAVQPPPATLPSPESKPAEPAKSEAALDGKAEEKPAGQTPAAEKPHSSAKTKQAEAAKPKRERHPSVPRPPRPIPQRPNNNPFDGIFGGAVR
jgi:hypothetical protein